jgi:phage protein U
MNLVAKYRLGGAALWTLGMEDVAATTAMRNVALAIAPDVLNNSLTIENTDTRQVNFGDIFTLKGGFTLKDKSPVAGLVVSVEMKRANETTWTEIAESTTALDGTISIPVTIAGTAAFRLTTVGTWERAESTSSEEIVTVRPRVILEHLSTQKHGVPMQIKGTLLPRTTGATATLQRLIAGKWQNIGASTATDSKGEFVLTTTEAKRGVVTMRIQIANGPQMISSSEFSIVVR